MATAITEPVLEPALRHDRPHVRLVVSPLPAGWYTHLKVGCDTILATILLLLASPVIVLAALAIKLTSSGPIFYSQLRVGRHGRPFRIYKLRSMTDNCEHWSGPKWSSGTNDLRVTRVGWFLRKTHLDELPQLWNVLRGDMSLVGPRPERPEFIPALEDNIPSYRNRLAVRPGLTGLAQVQLPADTDLDSVRRKLLYDLYYIDNVGVWLDVRLILSTALKVLHLPFVISRVILRIPSTTTVEFGTSRPEATLVKPILQPPQAACLQPEGAA